MNHPLGFWYLLSLCRNLPFPFGSCYNTVHYGSASRHFNLLLLSNLSFVDTSNSNIRIVRQHSEELYHFPASPDYVSRSAPHSHNFRIALPKCMLAFQTCILDFSGRTSPSISSASVIESQHCFSHCWSLHVHLWNSLHRLPSLNTYLTT